MFEIRLVDKKLMGTKVRKDDPMRAVMPTMVGAPYSWGGAGISPLAVEQNVPVTVEVKDFQYTYKCKHCGHVWAELHAKDDQVRGRSEDGTRGERGAAKRSDETYRERIAPQTQR